VEVSQLNKHVTHAVIGPHATIECGITDSAEFYQMLSSSLYRYPELAVVRETLCNAWDAHLEAGKQDLPIDITIDMHKMVIRDYGNGIPHDKIGPIYGVYGNSTKKHDGRQTGGFGLGCKSPFAYTEHFGVTSWNQGVKTIYRMSKSAGGEVVGKPGITPIVQIPDETQTGLEVEIKFNTPSDCHRFSDLIRRIVRNGGIKARLNGKSELLATLPYHKANLGYLVTTTAVSEDNQLLYVLYGNVVYPIPTHEGYEILYKDVETFMDKLSRNSIRLILMAPAHSIAVAPSRETLSMQPKTINTIRELLTNFMEVNKNRIEPEFRRQIQRVNTIAYSEGRINALLGCYHELTTRGAIECMDEMSSPEELARMYLARQYPSGTVGNQIYHEDFMHRLDLISQTATPLMKRFIDTYREHYTVGLTEWRGKSNWLHRNVISLILRKMRQGGLNEDTLHVLDGNSQHRSRSRASKSELIPAPYMTTYSTHRCAMYLRGIIVLSRATKGIATRLERFDGFKGFKLGRPDQLFVVIAPRKDAELQRYRDCLANIGMNFIDLTVKHNHEVIEAATKVKVVKAEKDEAPKEKGYPLLIGCYRDGSNRPVELLRAREFSCPKTESSEFYYRIALRKGNHESCIYPFDSDDTTNLVKAYGNRGVIITTELQEEKLKKLGVLSVEKFLMIELEKFYWSCRAARREFAFNHDAVSRKLDYQDTSTYCSLVADQLIQYKFGVHSKLRDEDKGKHSLLVSMLKKNHRYNEFSKKMMDTISTTRQSKKIENLVTQVKTNQLLKAINISKLTSIIRAGGTEADRALEILNKAIEG
jgi:hypothetical protein